MNAKIYVRRNGAFGASCDGCLDTGYTIMLRDDGCWTVYSLAEDGTKICADVTREEAERAIAEDWRRLL